MICCFTLSDLSWLSHKRSLHLSTCLGSIFFIQIQLANCMLYMNPTSDQKCIHLTYMRYFYPTMTYLMRGKFGNNISCCFLSFAIASREGTLNVTKTIQLLQYETFLIHQINICFVCYSTTVGFHTSQLQTKLMAEGKGTSIPFKPLMYCSMFRPFCGTAAIN